MRRIAAVTLAVAALVGSPGVATADAPGPTDFESSITAVTAVDGGEVPTSFVVTVEGIDSFMRLAIEPGSTATVDGYDGEPYLRIDESCRVWQNQLSWSTWYNEDRYGVVDRPDVVDSAADPDWSLIDDDCSVAWHDHRIHWMNAPLIGAEPGDVVIDTVVPVTIDGTDIDVRVQSVLFAPPSPRPSIAGAIIGIALVATVLVFGGRRLAAGSRAVAASAAVASVVGSLTFLTAASDTGPDPRWWALPVVSMLVATAAVALERTGRWFWANGLLLVAGLLLALWVWDRRSGLWRALIPSPWPGAIDRLVTSAMAVVGLAAIAGAIAVLVSPRAPRR